MRNAFGYILGFLVFVAGIPSMEAIMIWAKENYGLICLLVGVIGVLLSIIGFVYEMKKKKRKDKLHL